MTETISAEDLRTVLARDASATVLDTRDRASFEAWHIPGAINVPYAIGDELPPLEEVALPPGSTFTICAKGRSSSALADRLVEAGYAGVAVVEDGMTGWSTVFDAVPVDVDGPATIVQLQRVAKGCLSYLVGCSTSDLAVIVDPPRSTGVVIDALEAADLEAIGVIDTHVHADHVSGGPALAETLDVPYFVSDRSSDRGLVHEHEPVEPGAAIAVGEVDLEVLATPGHTTDATSLRVAERAVLTGDTLLLDGVGRTELEGAAVASERAGVLYDSIVEKLLTLAGDTRVLPGHFAPTAGTVRAPPSPRQSTIETLSDTVELLDVDRATFVERVATGADSPPPNFETIVAINLGHESLPDTETLTSLELGPNRCAVPA